VRKQICRRWNTLAFHSPDRPRSHIKLSDFGLCIAFEVSRPPAVAGVNVADLKVTGVPAAASMSAWALICARPCVQDIGEDDADPFSRLSEKGRTEHWRKQSRELVSTRSLLTGASRTYCASRFAPSSARRTTSPPRSWRSRDTVRLRR
jgi:hypothetical protein